MDNDNRNKFINTEIKWIIAQSVDGGEWEIKNIATGCMPKLLRDDGYIHPVIDLCPAWERDISQFAVFRNVERWWTKKPNILTDWRDKSNKPIPSGVGM